MMAIAQSVSSPPPPGWVALTSTEHTPLYVRSAAIIAYGIAPQGYLGNSWVIFQSSGEARYVLETMDELTTLLQ